MSLFEDPRQHGQETLPKVGNQLVEINYTKDHQKGLASTNTRQKGTPQNEGSGDDNAMPMSHAS
jgi:hypothetical protein